MYRVNQAHAGPFTPADSGIDHTDSIGHFQINLASAFGGGVYTSPILFDPNTTIQRTYVSSNEVDTQILSMNMSDALGNSVVAGLQQPSNAPNLHDSLGTVISNTGSGGFPATSSFHVYVDIYSAQITREFGVGAYLYNTDAMSIKNKDITSFPPGVVYTHDHSSPIDVYLYDPASSKDNGADNGALFGTLDLAGHGVYNQIPGVNTLADFQATSQGAADYGNFTANDPVPEVEQWLMLLAGLPLLGLRKREAVA